MSLLPTQGEGRDYPVRYAWALAVALALLFVLAGRLYYLQVVRGEYYAERSRSNFVKRVEIPADRGMILDRRGTILVDERPSYDVELTPAFCPEIDETLARLSAGLAPDPERFEAARAKLHAARGLERFRAVRVARDVDRDALDWIEAHSLELDGVDVRVRPQRSYRFGPMLGHVLGYMNEIGPAELERTKAQGLDYRMGDTVGRAGLEDRLEAELRGVDGMEQVVVDAKGRRVEQLASGAEVEDPLIPENERIIPSVPGHNLVLSIDMRLQRLAEEIFPGEAGAVVAVDPQTGYVLAMVSHPAFDPNRLSGNMSGKQMRELIEDPYEPMINRVIQNHYHPGSTFKVVAALAGLRTGTVTPEQGTSCYGGYTLGRRRWRCWKPAGHGFQALKGSLKHSCDTYYYWLADKLGIDAMAETARSLGFGRPTGLGLPHEIPGIIPDKAYHDRVTPDGYQHGLALNTAIGQGDVNVTPLQLAMAYAALGNGGVLYRPQLVRRIEEPDGKVVREFLPEVRGRLDADPQHVAQVVAGLRAVVEEPGGTAHWKKPRDLAVEVAGKTGTAQVVRMGASRVKSSDQDYWFRDHGWFAAFAPVQDPEIVVIVLNEHGGGGSATAAPTAMAVLKGYFDLKAEDEAQRAVQQPLREPGPPAQGGVDSRHLPSAPIPPPPARHATPVPLRPPPIHVDRG